MSGSLTSGAVTVVLESRVAAGRRPELEAFLVEAIPYYELPGGIAVSLHWDQDDPSRFREVVEYADRGTYERDQVRVEQDPTMRDLLARWHLLLDADLSVTTWVRADLPHPPSST